MKLLGFIVIVVFGLIIVIFILISLFDKHYTTHCVASQVDSSVFLKKYFNHEGHEGHEDCKRGKGGQKSDFRSQKTASPPVAGEKSVKKAGKMLKKV